MICRAWMKDKMEQRKRRERQKLRDKEGGGEKGINEIYVL